MQRLESEGRAPAETRAAMNLANPLYIPRNHKVEAALQSAESESIFCSTSYWVF